MKLFDNVKFSVTCKEDSAFVISELFLMYTYITNISGVSRRSSALIVDDMSAKDS